MARLLNYCLATSELNLNALLHLFWSKQLNDDTYRVFQKFVPIVHCILRKAFNASLGKFTLIQVRNLSK